MKAQLYNHFYPTTKTLNQTQLPYTHMQTIIFGQQQTQLNQPKVYIPTFARNQTSNTAAAATVCPQINTQGFHREIVQRHRTDVEEGGAEDGDPEPVGHPRAHPPCRVEPQKLPIAITDDFIDEIMNEINIEEQMAIQPTPRQQSTDVTDNTTDEEIANTKPILMPARKRDQKAAKTTCPGCQVMFFKLDATHNVCHNCAKIIGAIEA